mmetsp:Transcript_24527/g.40890  ORF Transcript_24527/g.40890 Transcript_24527/m.40890 type:complete len:259 (-) Transcript_24527:122-898(-)
MGFLKGLKKVGHAMANPTELKDLDKIVHFLIKQFEDQIDGFENDGTPPTADQAKEWEDERIEAFQNDYDRRAKDLCNRDPVDKHDNIAVRKRILGRKMEARRGKLFARFSDDVQALTVKAALTLKRCVEGLAELESSITEQLPLKNSYIASEFTALKDRLEEDIIASFPEGVTGLDNYDDELPEGVPSYVDFKASVDASQEQLLEANVAAVAEALAAYKQGVVAAVEASLNEDVVDFLEDDGAELKTGILDAVKAAVA